jgi:hypothetical protein
MGTGTVSLRIKLLGLEVEFSPQTKIEDKNVDLYVYKA